MALRRRRLIAGALSECARNEPTSIYLQRVTEEGLAADLLEAAVRHRVPGMVAQRMLATPGVPSQIAARAWALAEATAWSRRRVDDELSRVAQAFRTAGVPWLVVKGPVLAHLYYPDPTVRAYQDLDVVVKASALGAAVAALERAGYEVVDRNWALMARESIAQLHLVRPGGVPVDLHWHVLSNRRLRQSFDVEMDEIFDRSRLVQVGPLTCRAMSWEHQMVHLCVHAALEGADRLVWLVDVARAAGAAEAAWEDVAATSLRWRVNLVVGAVLSRARHHVAAPVPKWVVRELVPSSAWRLATGVVDRMWSPFLANDVGSPASLVARSMRATVASSLGEAAVGLARRARAFVLTGRKARSDTRRDRRSSKNLLYAAGGEEARAAYFSTVVRAGR